MNELFIDFLQQLLMNEMPKMTKSFFQNSRKTRFSCYLRCLHCFSSISLALLLINYPTYAKLINICSLFTLLPRLLLGMTHWWLKSSLVFSSSPTSTSGEGTTLTGDRGRGRHSFQRSKLHGNGDVVDNRGSLSMKFQEQLDEEQHHWCYYYFSGYFGS